MSPIPVVIVEPELPGCIVWPVAIIGIVFAVAVMGPSGQQQESSATSPSSYVASQPDLTTEAAREKATSNAVARGNYWMAKRNNENTPIVNEILYSHPDSGISFDEVKAVDFAKELMEMYDPGNWECISDEKNLPLENGKYTVYFALKNPQNDEDKKRRSSIEVEPYMSVKEIAEYVDDAIQRTKR